MQSFAQARRHCVLLGPPAAFPAAQQSHHIEVGAGMLIQNNLGYSYPHKDLINIFSVWCPGVSFLVACITISRMMVQYSENTNDHFLLENSVMVVKHHHHNTHPQARIHLAFAERRVLETV